jgi:hypothetical protein
MGAGTVRFAELGYVDTSGDGLIDAAELRAQEPAVSTRLVAIVRRHVHISFDGVPAMIIGAGVPIPKAADNVEPSEFVSLVFATSPYRSTVSNVGFEWEFTSKSPNVVLSRSAGAIASSLGDDGGVDFSLSAWASAKAFFVLGIDHIRSGLDHLLFLVVLTLAVVGTMVNAAATRRVVKLVTAFTIGHGISLALAYFDVISVPAPVVEPAIALSIAVVAGLALRGKAPEARVWAVGAVGLVHGLGFASSLGSLGVVASNRVPALAAFNLGIDVAQTAVVLATAATLWCVNAVLRSRAVWVRVPVTAAIGCVGLLWTITRLPF